ncbi:MAG: FAD-dependent oxidoreductase, partial [Clostridia bacterium]|nr:FAD-dependent oxidoreductase [Clostridia bacterium]
MYDIVIIGGGPAGLTAGIYARRANKTVLVIEKASFGGQITYSPKVENIPGFSEVTGNEFAENIVEQAITQGVEFESAEALKIIDGDVKKVVTDGDTFEAKAVIIATGAKHRRLGLPNEDKFIGDGISFCAVCDGAFFADKT